MYIRKREDANKFSYLSNSFKRKIDEIDRKFSLNVFENCLRRTTKKMYILRT